MSYRLDWRNGNDRGGRGGRGGGGRGRGGGGRGGRGGNQSAATSRQACRAFARGNCSYGERCRFSHSISASDPSTSAQTQAPGQREKIDERVDRFSRLVSARASGSGTSDQSPFALGLEIFTTVEDAGSLQETVAVLASEKGLSCIRHVVESRIPRAEASASTFAKQRIWVTDMRPLFRMVTFKGVVCSNILRDKVSKIYNFLAGVGAERLEVWFRLAVALAQAKDRSSSIPAIEIVELCLAVLATMLDYNAAHIANPVYRDYAGTFISMATDVVDITPETKMAKIQATEYASLVARRLEAGEMNPPTNHSAHQDLPGLLSGNGPRHDNDHDDIVKISILPTANEIASNRDEYLPAVDPALWHRPGIAGRLDREFRLLREDTIGQLREVVRTELDKLQQKINEGGSMHAQTRPKNTRDAVRYCTYHSASIARLDMDRRSGPEFVFRFRQPAKAWGEASSRWGTNDPKSKQAVAKSLNERRRWWLDQAKKRLQPGGLVCAIDSEGSSHFLIVANSTIRAAEDSQSHQKGKTGQLFGQENDVDTPFTLADDPTWSFVRLMLPPGSDDGQLQRILESLFLEEKIHKLSGSQSACVLVEFPGILLDSFLPTLQALQAAAKSLNIPFANLLAASSNAPVAPGQDGMAHIPPPKYAQEPGFVFDMSCLSPGCGVPLYHGVDAPITREQVELHTRLDTTQSSALIDALSRSVALVQGPPGTGKTFAGVEMLKVLLHNRKKAHLGPILIVCYTNHALDQLLEHVLDARAGTQIIRMGSLSKSERLKDMNLYEKSRAVLRSRSEDLALVTTRSKLNSLVNVLNILFGRLGRSTTINAVADHLQQHHAGYFRQIFGYGRDDYDDGFTTIHADKNKIFRRWLQGPAEKEIEGEPAETQTQETREQICERLRAMEEEKGNLDLSLLTANERSAMLWTWASESFSQTASLIRAQHTAFVVAKKKHEDAMREADLRCLQRAEIVGVTTTGLARNLSLLKNLRCKVLLCEEAGEVLEAHMLASLVPSLEHVILIGDHQQLRPQVQNYELRSDNPRGAQYSFDMSLFERLVSPVGEDEISLPFSQLFTQRRMHPSISDLIRAPLYPSLEDGPNVSGYPAVPGMERRLFWLQHEQLEQGASHGDRQADPTSTSRTNLFEVEMTASFVAHLLKQGVYGPGDIAVLTPYLGQMMLLQRRMSGMFEIALNERDEADLATLAAVNADADANTGTAPTDRKAGATGAAVATRKALSNSVRIATVDNFQGEEAKVVIVSMVRSNKEQRCGFLSTSNRINVLLSRAQHGLYIIGNSETCSRVPMWQQVLEMLEEGGNIGPSLPLQCPRHPERRFAASVPQHFLQFAPDGGCMEVCNKALPCQHLCNRMCHSDILHGAVKCDAVCERPRTGCSHACPRTCSEACPKRCTVVLTGDAVRLPCGHVLESPECWQVQKPEAVECVVKVRHTVPGCGHAMSLQCNLGKAVSDSDKCKAVCGAALPCGHACSRSCYTCRTRRGGRVIQESHGACQRVCGRQYDTCEHTCASTCHADEAGQPTACPPCPKPCTVQCSHAACKLTCGEPCEPCAETTCAVQCRHGRCSSACAAPCDWVPCSERCDKLLSCGHACPSMCGEPCPSEALCQACAGPETLAQVVNRTTMATYGDVDLAEEPCVVLSCGHVVAVSFMDGLMGMDHYYEMESGSGSYPRPVALREVRRPFGANESIAACPHCHKPPRTSARYGRITRQKLWETSIKKTVARSDYGLLQLVSCIAGTDASSVAGTAYVKKMLKADWHLGRKTSRMTVFNEVLRVTSKINWRLSLSMTRRGLEVHARKTHTEEKRCKTIAKLTKKEVTCWGQMRIGGHLQAKLLLLRFDAMTLVGMALALSAATTRDSTTSAGVEKPIQTSMEAVAAALLDGKLTVFLHDCDAAITKAQTAKNVRQEVEARLLYVNLYHAAYLLFDLVMTRKWCMVKNGIIMVESLQKQLEASDRLKDELQGVLGMLGVCKEHLAWVDEMLLARPETEVFQAERDRLGALLAAIAASRPLDMPSQAVYAQTLAEDMSRAYEKKGKRSREGKGRWCACANRHVFAAADDSPELRPECAGLQCPECFIAVEEEAVNELEEAMGGVRLDE